jgi:hypothetical protein
MPAKPPDAPPPDSAGQGRFWQPPEKRNVISEEGRRWQEENADAIKAWRARVEKNGVPLRPLF